MRNQSLFKPVNYTKKEILTYLEKRKEQQDFVKTDYDIDNILQYNINECFQTIINENQINGEHDNELYLCVSQHHLTNPSERKPPLLTNLLSKDELVYFYDKKLKQLHEKAIQHEFQIANNINEYPVPLTVTFKSNVLYDHTEVLFLIQHYLKQPNASKELIGLNNKLWLNEIVDLYNGEFQTQQENRLKQLLFSHSTSNFSIYISVLTRTQSAGHYQLIGFIPEGNGNFILENINSIFVLKTNQLNLLIKGLAEGAGITISATNNYLPFNQPDKTICGGYHVEIVNHIFNNPYFNYRLTKPYDNTQDPFRLRLNHALISLDDPTHREGLILHPTFPLTLTYEQLSLIPKKEDIQIDYEFLAINRFLRCYDKQRKTEYFADFRDGFWVSRSNRANATLAQIVEHRKMGNRTDKVLRKAFDLSTVRYWANNEIKNAILFDTLEQWNKNNRV